MKMKLNARRLKRFFTGAFFLLAAALARGEDPKTIKAENPPPTGELSLLLETRHSLESAFKFLLEEQREDGSWKDDPAITSLALYAFLLPPAYRTGDKTAAAIKKGFGYLEDFVQPDGGIYRKEYRNYVTAVCLLAFTETNEKKYQNIITEAKKFLIEYQVDETEDISQDHPYYGGIGYGGDSRPDLSNTHLALEAIKAAEDYEKRFGFIPKDPKHIDKDIKEYGLHWQKALVFLARCQNLKSVNEMPYATDDGGFIYETGTYKEERSHSYGSMTYAGVKSLVYAQVSKEDARVKKAAEWLGENYTWEENPGFGTTSLYYYYMTAAKCLNALGDDMIKDAAGQPRPWRTDLLKKLISLQKEDGYWENPDGRYWENVKTLTTAYSVIAMKNALQGLGPEAERPSGDSKTVRGKNQ